MPRPATGAKVPPCWNSAEATTTAQHGEETTISTTQHYHLNASTPERLLALTTIHGTYLGALAEARRLVVEARPAAGWIEHIDTEVVNGQHVEGYLVEDAGGAVVVTVALSGPCFGLHLSETPEGAARAA